MAEIKRTYAEEFRLTYGYDWPYEHQPCRGALPDIAPDDMSELYWKVKERCEELGIETDILARLRQAEDDALDWLDLHGMPAKDYAEMMAEYELEYEWED